MEGGTSGEEAALDAALVMAEATHSGTEAVHTAAAVGEAGVLPLSTPDPASGDADNAAGREGAGQQAAAEQAAAEQAAADKAAAEQAAVAEQELPVGKQPSTE